MIPFATMTERFAVRSTTKMNGSKSSSRKNARGTKGTQRQNSNRLPYYLTSLDTNKIYSANHSITNSYNKKDVQIGKPIIYKNIYNNTFFNTPGNLPNPLHLALPVFVLFHFFGNPSYQKYAEKWSVATSINQKRNIPLLYGNF